MPMVDDLSERFKENVGCSTHVDIAVAWATETSALDQLVNAVEEENGVSLRIIVGTHGSATDPDVLDRLNDIGKLRIVPHRGPLFHPKVYIFRGEDSIALIGSANFTNGGFGENVEAVFETKQLRAVRKWFNSQWKQCGKLRENADRKSRKEAIEKYRRRRRLNPPSGVIRDMMGAPMRDSNSRLGYLDGVQDWRGYVSALTRCQEWWEDHPRDWTVYGATRSWTHTIEQVMPIAIMDDWGGLNRNEVNQLLGRGIYGDLDSGLLGTMRPKSVNRFLEDADLRRSIKDAVNHVVNAHSTDFPNVAVTAVNNIVLERDMGIGVATRILALARPDRVVSLNGASGEGLAQIFPGIDRLNPRRDSVKVLVEHYGRFLRQLYAEPWFDSKKPRGALERRLWSMRAALLDCFVYAA